jgi:phenylalanyl-tRNA synthetase beta chain
MGGRTSEVSAATTSVLLESASFTRGGVLLTGRRLGLHTEASHRFERGTDPEGVGRSAVRGAKLIADWTGGTVLAGAAEAGAAPPRVTVAMRPSRATALLGFPVTTTDAVDVFDVLGMPTTASEDRVEVEIPGYRTDLESEVDLIEEVVRIEGYDRVGATLPRAPHVGGVPGIYAFARRAKGSLRRAGLREIRPAPFVSAADLALFADDDAVPVANPLRAEEGFLRTRLTTGLLRTVALNQARGAEVVRLFEVGTTFRLAEPFVEVRKAGFVLAGAAGTGWAGERRELDVLDAKGVLGSLFSDLGVIDWALGDLPPGPFHPGRAASVLIAGEPAGVLGEIHPVTAERLGLAGRVSVGVVGLGSVQRAAGRAFAFEDVPRFPPVRRDLAFIVPEDVPAEQVRAALVEAAGELLDACTLFDVFRGGSLPEGTKSLAFTVELRARDRTLTDDEAQVVVERMVERVVEAFDAELRAR